MAKSPTKKTLVHEVLERSVDKIYPSKQSLEEALLSGRKLKIYLGVDPTGPHLHLGHVTNLLVLKKFQSLGHQIIFLIGDFTGRIGDPSDRLAARKPLTEKEVRENLKTFKRQASKILRFTGPNKALVKFNSSWHSKMKFEDVLRLAQNLTVQQLIKRAMFQKKLKEGKLIGLHEFLYPLMQGYDSVAMNVDMEIGGTDQTFNMLVGRDLMKILKRKEKFVLTTKLLINPETGSKLMNKSEGGLINLDDNPNDMFGKVMAINDKAIFTLAEFSTEMPINRISHLKKGVAERKINPRDAKLEIAFYVVKLCCDEKTAERSKREFIHVFSKKELPKKIPSLKIKKKKNNIVDLIAKAQSTSKSEARRLIEQGAVKINSETKKNSREILTLQGGEILKLGKRHFFKIVLH
ncbi:MAG: tyrosine--tRNA ligase [Patescibacteria group bacterium]|nr:tyrosine--tRNA ligase [Patescibacteria group bacterium]